MKKTALKSGFAVLAAYALLLGALWGVMHRPIAFGKLMKHMPNAAFVVIPFKQLWFSARAGDLKPGERAPDFDLQTTDGKSQFRLSSLRGRKPVVLIFGSYS